MIEQCGISAELRGLWCHLSTFLTIMFLRVVAFIPASRFIITQLRPVVLSYLTRFGVIIVTYLTQFDALVAALPVIGGGEEAQYKRIAELQVWYFSLLKVVLLEHLLYRFTLLLNLNYYFYTSFFNFLWHLISLHINLGVAWIRCGPHSPTTFF